MRLRLRPLPGAEAAPPGRYRCRQPALGAVGVLRGYPRAMPKLSIYLPDHLYREARDRHLPLSALAREAVENALRSADRHEWAARMRARPHRPHEPVDVPAVLADVREEFGA